MAPSFIRWRGEIRGQAGCPHACFRTQVLANLAIPPVCRRCLFRLFARRPPIPVPAAVHKDASQPFPCQNHPCGCRTAEQCWPTAVASHRNSAWPGPRPWRRAARLRGKTCRAPEAKEAGTPSSSATSDATRARNCCQVKGETSSCCRPAEALDDIVFVEERRVRAVQRRWPSSHVRVTRRCGSAQPAGVLIVPPFAASLGIARPPRLLLLSVPLDKVPFYSSRSSAAAVPQLIPESLPPAQRKHAAASAIPRAGWAFTVTFMDLLSRPETLRTTKGSSHENPPWLHAD